MTCQECQHLKSHGDTGAAMARLGFGGCTEMPRYTFRPITRERECSWFVRADDARIARVRAYAKGKA